MCSPSGWGSPGCQQRRGDVWEPEAAAGDWPLQHDPVVIQLRRLCFECHLGAFCMLPGFHYRSGESRQVVKESLERELSASGAFWGRFPPRGMRNTAGVGAVRSGLAAARSSPFPPLLEPPGEDFFPS